MMIVMTAKDKAFLSMAEIMAGLSPCSRAKVGAVIVRGDVPVVSSFNGIARKQAGLCGGDCCLRDANKIPSGSDTQIGCHHAEFNAIANASRCGIATDGCSIYVTAPPCLMCAKLIHHAGIKSVVYENKSDRWISTGEGYLSANGIGIIKI
jgi:dCMP deaminase